MNSYHPNFRKVNEVLDEMGMDGIALEADVMSAMMQMGWVPMSYNSLWDDRAQTVAGSRRLARKDPLAANAIRLWLAFVIGQGFEFAVRPDQEGSPEGQRLIRFWEHAQNRSVFRFQGQKGAYRELLLEGELHFSIFFGAPDTVPVVRHIEPSTRFLKPILDPNDATREIYYPYRSTKVHIDYKDDGPEYTEKEDIVRYFRSWDATIWDLTRVRKPPNVQNRATMVKWSINQHDGRGWPLLESVIDWIRAYKGFMEDRVSFSRAMAKFAWRLRDKISPTDARALAARVEQLNAEAMAEGKTSGGVFTSGDNLNLEPASTSTHGDSARNDARLLRQQICAGVGITEPNLTGDPSVGNLASLTAMDAVMTVAFMSDQFLLMDGWRDIFSSVVCNGVHFAEQISAANRWVRDNVIISVPDVVQEDRMARINGLLASADRLPPTWLTLQLLRALGEEAPESIITEDGFDPKQRSEDLLGKTNPQNGETNLRSQSGRSDDDENKEEGEESFSWHQNGTHKLHI